MVDLKSEKEKGLGFTIQPFARQIFVDISLAKMFQ
jgi:hypothetical protein